MKLFVGLGNPGDRYARNRHNVGFMAVDAIARAHRFGPWRGRFHGQTAEGRLAGEQVLLLKPMTFMNESGRAVGEMKRFFKLAPADIVVFHDELDLAPGKVRVKAGGGHAGHNGLRSIEAHIGADFHRVRVGIGHPGAREQVTAYVLRDFAKADADWLEPLLDAMAEAAPHLAKGDAGRFMNRAALAGRDGAASEPVDAGGASKPARAAGPRPESRAKSAAKARRAGKTPSQRDLARAAASPRRDKSKSAKPPAAAPEPDETGGALAGLLRRWLGRGPNR